MSSFRNLLCNLQEDLNCIFAISVCIGSSCSPSDSFPLLVWNLPTFEKHSFEMDYSATRDFTSTRKKFQNERIQYKYICPYQCPFSSDGWLVCLIISFSMLEIEGTTCCICLDADCDYLTQCNHFFHKECLEKWIQQKEKCPLCNSKLQCRYHPVRQLQKYFILDFHEFRNHLSGRNLERRLY
jgi:hypothetical protein